MQPTAIDAAELALCLWMDCLAVQNTTTSYSYSIHKFLLDSSILVWRCARHRGPAGGPSEHGRLHLCPRCNTKFGATSWDEAHLALYCTGSSGCAPTRQLPFVYTAITGLPEIGLYPMKALKPHTAHT